MNPFTYAYEQFLYTPLLNLLVGITNALPGENIGWAIIIVTIIVRLILLPSSYHHAKVMQRNQGKMASLQSKLAELKKEHKDDPSKQAEATMKLYRESGVNPASGCLPLLIQLPILIALYRVFLTGLDPTTLTNLYDFVQVPTQLVTTFFGINLLESSLRLGFIAGVAQFIQMRYLSPTPTPPPTSGDNDDTAAAMTASMQKNMSYILPVMTVFFSAQFPAALALYWATSTIIGMAQQYALKKSLHLEANPPSV